MNLTDAVRRFLVTGPTENLHKFHLVACWRLNGIEQRNQTVIYTCLSEDAAFAQRAADAADVTLQEIEIVNNEETYPVLRLGTHGLQWERKVSA